MDGVNVIWLLGVLLFIGFGIAFTNPKWYSKFIKLNNQAKGVKTNITSQTFLVGKTLGWGLIILGVVNLILIFLGY